MKVAIHISASDALKAGLDDHGYKVVEVPAASLTPEQREYLGGGGHNFGGADSHQSGIPPHSADFAVFRSPHKPVRATVEEAIACIQAYIDKKKAEKEEEEARREAKVAEWLARPLEAFITMEYDRAVGENLPEVNPPASGKWPYIPDDPRLAPRVAEAVELAARRRAELVEAATARKAKEAADKAEAERVKAEGEATLERWAAESGSELLRARIADGFEWLPLAEAEYGQHAMRLVGMPKDEAGCPDGYEDTKYEGRTAPTLDEIRALRAAREAIRRADIPATAELQWVTYKPEEDEDGYRDEEMPAIRRCEVYVKLTTPTGHTRGYYYLPADILKAEDA